VGRPDFHWARLRLALPPGARGLGIQYISWHDLRHFCASVCASKGIDICDVSVWLGHASVSTTQSTYVHLSGARIRTQ